MAANQDKYKAFRYDKGHRVMAGLVHSPDSQHYMVVDDDSVSSRLAGFVAKHPQANGWLIGDGYWWTEGSDWTFIFPKIQKLCGSTHIMHMHRDLMKIPAKASDAPLPHIRWLGQHTKTTEDRVAAGRPLARLPFAGTVYRVGHANAHSVSRSIWRTFIFRKDLA